jgi:hypothetical protein
MRACFLAAVGARGGVGGGKQGERADARGRLCNKLLEPKVLRPVGVPESSSLFSF